MIKENPQVSTADMAKELKIGIATVKRKIKKCLMYHMSEVVTVDTGRLTNRKCIILFKLWKEKNSFWAKLVQVIIF